MPYANPNRAREYFRDYRRTRRAGDDCSTPVHPAIPTEFRLQTAQDVIDTFQDLVAIVAKEQTAGVMERARRIGYLCGIQLRAIESGNMAARIEGLEKALEERNGEQRHEFDFTVEAFGNDNGAYRNL